MSTREILIVTTDGSLRLKLFEDKVPRNCRHFVELCRRDYYDSVPCLSIIKDFYIRFAAKDNSPLDDSKDFDPPQADLYFDKVGIVGFDSNYRLLISLDRCDAIGEKYFIVGYITEDTIDVLKRMGDRETDETDAPLNPLSILCVKVYPIDDNIGKQKTPPPPSQLVRTSTVVLNTQTPLDSPAHLPFSSVTPLSSSSTKKRKRDEYELSSSDRTGQKLTSSSLFSEPFDRQPSVIPDQIQFYYHLLAEESRGEPKTTLSRGVSMPNLRHVNIPPKYPSRLVIVRHGESEQNVALDLPEDSIDIDKIAAIRDADIKLTERGQLQALQTGKYLAATARFDVCFSSPYLRAIRTAELIAKRLGYPLKIYKDNRLREKEFGRLHGLLPKNIKERFPIEYAARERDGKYWYRFPGGENYPDVEMRISSFIEKVARQYAGRSILVVTHQVPFKLFRAIFQHLDEAQTLALEEVKNCAVQEYVIDRSKNPAGRMKLKNFNFIAYDPERLSLSDDNNAIS
jgi:broad specificity phosphatase PhoE/cyclophilin family peptidyl-prolyl cis-trans isomerase